jgi:hypothetical protein
VGTAGVIGLVLWLLLGLAGAWLLITGRRLVFGLPRDFKEGWPVRIYGLAYVLVAVFVAYEGYRASRGLSVPSGIVFIYGAVAFTVLLLVLTIFGRRRGAQTAGPAAPGARLP